MASAAEPATTPSSSIYAQVDSYPWDTDAEFQGGLIAILGSNPSPDQAAELNLRARCFYYSRKFNASVDFDAYKAYRESIQAPPPSTTPTAPNGIPPATITPATTSTLPDPAPAPAPASASGDNSQEAPYPTSFAHIVELITTGQPIPGIKDIPNTILEGQGTQSAKAQRRKPWERDVGVAAGPGGEAGLPGVGRTTAEAGGAA